ncbi:hypothetical protein EJB05_04725, partial [Eragrostis curvula]
MCSKIFDYRMEGYKHVAPKYIKPKSKSYSGIYCMLFMENWTGQLLSVYTPTIANHFKKLLCYRPLSSQFNESEDPTSIRDAYILQDSDEDDD